jgi:hypothetical protein
MSTCDDKITVIAVYFSGEIILARYKRLVNFFFEEFFLFCFCAGGKSEKNKNLLGEN